MKKIKFLKIYTIKGEEMRDEEGEMRDEEGGMRKKVKIRWLNHKLFIN